jgi:hypothetical protein
MCDTHAHDDRAQGRLVSRRRVLQGMVGVAGLAALQSAALSPRGVPLAARTASATGHTAYVLAMHLHASSSEGEGSFRSHLAEAAANGFDVAWFTEHDWRRRSMFRRTRYHFLPEDSAVGGRWWLPPLPPVGSLQADSGGQLVSEPTSPDDPAAAKGSLKLRATSTGDALAGVGHRIDSGTSSLLNLRGRILGRTVSVDVLPTATGPGAWGELRFALSHHPGWRDRPAGIVSLVYRLRSDVTRRTVTRNGATGIVDVPVVNGRWQTVTVDLAGDAYEVWPVIDPRDNSLQEIEFRASSRWAAPAELFYGYLRFDEKDYDGLGVERDLVAAYAEKEPGVLGLIGTELSMSSHVNQYGGPQLPFDYGGMDSPEDRSVELRSSLVDHIHRQGGLASINHPFIPTGPMRATTAPEVARDLLMIDAGGADILEVGYGSPGLLPDHFAVWDTLARNGLFLTGNGATDDHSGHDWASQEGRFYTATWASTLTERSLLDGLSRGRAYVGYLGSFGGTIDMTLDTDVPMGAVSVSPRTSRTLRMDVTRLPAGGAVEVVRGDVDYAGAADPNPNTTVVTTLGAGDLASRSAIPIDTGDDCFVRLQVVDATGGVVAFGQPIWSLRTPPPNGIPPARRVRG